MKRILLCLLMLAVFVTPLMASEMLAEINSKFTYKDNPIHPFLIRQFLNWSSDHQAPILKTVDISAAFDTDKDQLPDIKKNDDWYYAEEDEYDGEFRLYESFYYHWLGKMDNGIHVLETGSNGGGSGFFMDLMFVRFSEDKIMWDDKQETQLLMSIVGIYSLGDRYDGDIKVCSNKVVISASKGQFGGGAIAKQVELKFSK